MQTFPNNIPCELSTLINSYSNARQIKDGVIMHSTFGYNQPLTRPQYIVLNVLGSDGKYKAKVINITVILRNILELAEADIKELIANRIVSLRWDKQFISIAVSQREKHTNTIVMIGVNDTTVRYVVPVTVHDLKVIDCLHIYDRREFLLICESGEDIYFVMADENGKILQSVRTELKFVCVVYDSVYDELRKRVYLLISNKLITINITDDCPIIVQESDFRSVNYHSTLNFTSDGIILTTTSIEESGIYNEYRTKDMLMTIHPQNIIISKYNLSNSLTGGILDDIKQITKIKSVTVKVHKKEGGIQDRIFFTEERFREYIDKCTFGSSLRILQKYGLAEKSPIITKIEEFSTRLYSGVSSSIIKTFCVLLLSYSAFLD